ncbi:SixA phosphatase family protein [Aureibacter tunicatorum]|uniref:Phosphohistidine phosphatase n=1 Tax=Aureibacter tunicatorum TaxID=866807 RepID=A0AAE3XPU3_9BACT|nr:histidine phosphatase family protein [Aureibacter tunicatorum]MDR6239835.1 phosphohistidine phosphatase [Aureibacter tunicatorum]BDD04310.1 phosphoglycerate mutase [Aureibacter tunicatorum]
MKQLFLLRHGDAEPISSQFQKDKERRLSHLGAKEALTMGKIFDDKNIKLNKIICSEALRTQQTAVIFAKHINFPTSKLEISSKLYHANVNEIIKLIEAQDDDDNNILIIGHNPALSIASENLSQHSAGSLPTCGLTNLELSLESWQHIIPGIFEFKKLEYPSMYPDVFNQQKI